MGICFSLQLQREITATARNGKKGFCLNFVSQYDIDLILSIEKKINSTIQEIFIDDDDIMSDISLVSKLLKFAK